MLDKTTTLKTENNPMRCQHGKILQEMCLDCLSLAKQNQPCWKKIYELQNSSSIIRSALEPNCTLTIEGNDYEMKTMRSKNDEKFPLVWNLLQNTFKKDKLDSEKSFKSQLNGKTLYGKDCPQYRCFYVEDKEGKVIASRTSEQFTLKNRDGALINKNTFYGIYIAVEKKYQKSGLGKELYTSALVDASIEAERQGKKLIYIIAECSAATEKLQNKIGLKRIYFKNKNQLKEFEYYQPAIEFDTTTGEPKSGEPAEHLMLCKMEDGLLTTEELYENILGLYEQYKNTYSREVFNNESAFEKYEMYFKNLAQKASEQIEKGEEIILLSAEERDMEAQKNTEIINFDKADNT